MLNRTVGRKIILHFKKKHNLSSIKAVIALIENFLAWT